MSGLPGMPVLHPELPAPPEAPPAPETPPAPPPPAEPPAAPPEQTPPPAPPAAGEGQGLIFGKYRTLDEAQKGYFEQVNSFMREQAKAQALESLLTSQRASPAPPQPPPPDPAMEELENSGIPPQVLESFVQRVVQREAAKVFQAQVAPWVAGQQARAAAAQRLPDFDAREQQVADFIQASPELDVRYRRMFQADPLAAMEWAYFQHSLTVSSSAPAPPVRQSAAPPVAPAALPQPVGTARQAPPAATAEEMEKARQYALTYGDPMPWLRMRLRGILPEGTT